MHGMSFGLPRLAKSLVRQRVEACFGLFFLVPGFATQAAVYYGSHGNASVVGWRQDFLGALLLLCPLLLAAAVWRWWVPRLVRSQWEKTWRIGWDGKPLEG